MKAEPKDFVHVLLFRCSSCGLPIVNAVTSASKSLEEIDLDFHNVVCICGWSGEESGLEAKRHWVEAWKERRVPDQLEN
jgi:hypothetical protein